jgi:hypothetical protein
MRPASADMHTKAEKKDCRPNGRPAGHAPQRADYLFHSVLLLFKGAAVVTAVY